MRALEDNREQLTGKVVGKHLVSLRNNIKSAWKQQNNVSRIPTDGNVEIQGSAR